MEKGLNLTKTKLKLIWEAPKIKLLDEKAEAELKAVLEPFCNGSDGNGNQIDSKNETV